MAELRRILKRFEGRKLKAREFRILQGVFQQDFGVLEQDKALKKQKKAFKKETVSML